MLNIFYPKLYINTIKDIDYDKLKKKNIKGLIFDLDNTIVANNVKEAPDDIVTFFEKLKSNGFNISILSNNNKERVELFVRKINIPYIYDAKKPNSKGIIEAMKLINSKPYNTAIIGDQIFTDILCGNINKVYTILIKPISKDKDIIIKIKRILEYIVIKFYKKNFKN